MHGGNDAARELITLPHSNGVAGLQRLQIMQPPILIQFLLPLSMH